MYGSGNKSPGGGRNSYGFQLDGSQALKSPKSKTFLNALGKEQEMKDPHKNPEKQWADSISPNRKTTKVGTKNHPFPLPSAN